MTFDLAGERLVSAPIIQWPDEEPLELAVWNTFFVCRRCQEGVVLKARGLPYPNHREKPSSCSDELISAGFEPIEFHPKPADLKAPEHVPAAIARNYIEATDNLRRRVYTSAAMMFRKVLERATREMAPEDKKAKFRRMRLEPRIDALADDGALTDGMRDWAHLIRLDGNEAVHDEDADEATATQLQAFTELFLIYAFTLPERVTKHGGKAPSHPD
ncbi:MAG: DUF4145 domain-containing protein [Spirochaetaceae bacterium]|nr:DUF4145 domain-containing protein [Spirochaetaceae bacterium]